MKVTIYGTERCGSCIQLKQEFSDKGIKFEAKDIDASTEAYKELISAGYRSVPVVKIIDTNNIQLFFNIVDYETKGKVFDLLKVTE